MYGIIARLYVAVMLFLGATVVIGVLMLKASDASRPHQHIGMGHSR
jgi:hypothetical protein